MNDQSDIPVPIDAFIVLDLDRTLLNTDALMDLLFEQLSQTDGTNTEEVQAAKNVSYAHKGKSFDVTTLIDDRFGDGTFERLHQQIIAMAHDVDMRKRLLYAGASDLIETLESAGSYYSILTHGSQEFQSDKLRLLGALTDRLEPPFNAYITTETNKAEWINRQWQRDRARFMVPNDVYRQRSVAAQSIIVIDDKRTNLETTNEHIKGILVDNDTHPAEGTLSVLDIAMHLSMWEGKFDEIARHYTLSDRLGIDKS